MCSGKGRVQFSCTIIMNFRCANNKYVRFSHFSHFELNVPRSQSHKLHAEMIQNSSFVGCVQGNRLQKKEAFHAHFSRWYLHSPRTTKTKISLSRIPVMEHVRKLIDPCTIPWTSARPEPSWTKSMYTHTRAHGSKHLFIRLHCHTRANNFLRCASVLIGAELLDGFQLLF